MDHKSIDEEKTLELLKELSVQDFLDVGLHQVAYIKCTKDRSYSVHAADGSQISVMDSYDTAIAAIRVNDLFPVTVH
jgi:hypothetical protein